MYTPHKINGFRVRNSANPFVRDMRKYLRTSQMSVHGYPEDKSILLQLGLLKFQEERAGTSHADIDQDDVSLPGLLLGALGRTVCYCFIPARSCVIVGR